MDNGSTRHLNRLIPILFILLALLARIIPGPRTIDDAYITYRYARNILAGEGFVYNPGEQVLGTTTPLYTLILVCIGAFTNGVNANFPEIALVINAIFDALTTLLLWRIGLRLGYKLAGISAALLWAIAPFSVTFAIGGLETSLYVLLLTASAYFYSQEQHTLSAFCGALSLITRPDALLLLGPLVIARLTSYISIHKSKPSLKSKRRLLRTTIPEIIAFLLPTIVWFSYAWFYFGSPIPNSIMAKSMAYRLSDTAAFSRLIQHYATPFLGNLTFGIPWIAVGMFLYTFLFAVGARATLKENSLLWPWIVYPWLYLAAFAIANPLIFRWYLTPPLAAYIFLILVGLEDLLRAIMKFIQKRARARSWLTRMGHILLPTFFLLPFVLTIHDWTLYPDHGPNRPAPEMAWFKLELLYRQAAEVLNEEIGLFEYKTPPVLAAGDVGVLGFFTPTIILDTVGLNSPQSLDYYPLDEANYVTNYAIPPDLIFEHSPDYIITLEAYIREGLLIDPRFDQHYILIKKIATDIYGSDGMLIFKKR